MEKNSRKGINQKMKYMNRQALLGFVIVIIAICCSNRREVNIEKLYGNSFIRLDVMEDFRSPSTWESFELFDSAFHIRIPSYMKLSQKVPLKDGGQSLIYTYNDTTNSENFHYGYIGIDYFKQSKPICPKATDCMLHDEKNFMRPLVQAALKGGMRITDKVTVQDGKLINGPFYEIHSFFSNKNGEYTQYYGYDAYYRRNGHVKGEGAVSCHIFFLPNYSELAIITVSHYDKDSLIFENLFKVIKTFKWSNIH